MGEKVLINSKIVSYVDGDKNTNLHYAAARGNLDEIVKEIDQGSEIDPINYLGWTPLMMATRNGHTEVVKFMLEKRADSTRINKFGYNILLMAVTSQKLELLHLVLQHLLSGGVSKKIMENFFSPISLAMLFKCLPIIEYLIAQEFTLTVPSFLSGMTSENFAVKLGDKDIYNLIMTHIKKPNMKQIPIIEEPQQPCVKQVPQMEYHNGQGQPPVSPLIIVGQPQYNPQPQPSPYYNFIPNPYVLVPRRCSDIMSPMFSPNLSPYTPTPCVQQVFFPSNFASNQFVSPNPVPVFNNDELNQRIVHSPYYTHTPFNSPYNGMY